VTSAVVVTPDLREIVAKALKAFRNDSSYTADMIKAARALESRKSKR
jgi:hypothetical protein